MESLTISKSTLPLEDLRVRITVPDGAPAEEVLNTLTACVDVARLGLATESGTRGSFRVRRLHYGSQMEMIIALGGTTVPADAVAKGGMNLLDSILDLNAKAATLRSLVAEREAGILEQARATAASNWRIELASSTDEEISRDSPGRSRRSLHRVPVSPSDADAQAGAPEWIEVDDDELEAAQLIQMARLMQRRVNRLVKKGGASLVLTSREVRSLILLSGTDFTIAVVEQDEP